MSGKQFPFEIVSAEGTHGTEQVIGLNLPGITGRFGVLAGHEPAVFGVEPGPMLVRTTAGHRRSWLVSAGFLVVRPDKTSLIAERAENEESLDSAAADQLRRETERLVTALD